MWWWWFRREVVFDSCDPRNCSLPGSSVHGILQARILEWVTISFSRGSSRPRNRIRLSSIAGRFFIYWAMRAVKCTPVIIAEWRKGKSGGPTAEWGRLRRVGMSPSRRSSSSILQRAAERQRPSGLDPAPPHPSGSGWTLPHFTTAPPQEPHLVAASFHSPSLERPSSPRFYFYGAGCVRNGSRLPKGQQGQKPAASSQQVAG